MEKVPMIPERVLQEILQFARDAGVERLVLFGSRARGTHPERSDMDLAVYGGVLFSGAGRNGEPFGI